MAFDFQYEIGNKSYEAEYIFHTEDGMPWSENTYKRNWLRLMHDAGCTTDKHLSDEERAKLRRPMILSICGRQR